MDNNKSYNEFEEQFNDLPLPAEEQSWQKMKQMLDDDDRNRKPVVPIFLKSCAGWGLALLLIGTVAWFVLKPQTWWQSQRADNKIETSKPDHNILHPDETNKSLPTENGQSKPGDVNTIINSNSPGEQDNSSATNETNGQAATTKSITNANSTIHSAQKPVTGNGQLAKATTAGKSNPGTSLGSAGKPKVQSPTLTKTKTPVSKDKPISKDGLETPGKTAAVIAPAINSSDPVQEQLSVTSKQVVTKDSVVKRADAPVTDTAVLKQPSDVLDTASVVEKKENRSKKTKLVFSAGVGLQQQIPIGGQKAVPYDYYGRTGSLSDYIPSVYLRAGKENKWFAQGEFRYGAPQTLQDFQYSRKTIVDTQFMTVTTYRLKKTYYHQLPFSFNYYVLPNLTIGVGGIYNRFYGAVTEREVMKKDLQTQVQTMSKEIVNIQHFNDSFLYKTQVHALVQTEYHWKRFDFGLRYTKDIQPYIKYTQPDGKIDVKKNQTFQLLVRYRIWQSGRKLSE